MRTVWAPSILRRFWKLPAPFSIIIILAVFFVLATYYHSPTSTKLHTHHRFIDNLPNLRNDASAAAWENSQVEIVIWTSPTILKSRLLRLDGIKESMEIQRCFEGCGLKVSRNQSEVNRADAVVFFMFTKGYNREELPLRRSRDQIWIYNQHEPPPKYSPRAHFNGIFNWTMTYRKDSDIYQPYLRTFPLSRTAELTMFRVGVPTHEWIKGKTELVAAVISNCRTRSRREEILKNLISVGIPVHIYGACGNRTNCTNANSCTQFWEGLASRYKFYFAFENSLCSDYVTEKLWRPLDFGIVPVVLGKGEYRKLAPPNSYIDLRDFSSPEELKGYLQKLDNDPDEYAKYFDWRGKYSVKYNTDNLCDLCQKLRSFRNGGVPSSSTSNNPSFVEYLAHPRSTFMNSKVYQNLTGWWAAEPGRSDRSACTTPEGMGLSKFLK